MSHFLGTEYAIAWSTATIPPIRTIATTTFMPISTRRPVDGAEVLYLSGHPSPVELDELASQYQRMWILYTSYVVPAEMQEPLDQWVQAQEGEFARVRIKASTTIAYRNRSLTDAEAILLDRSRLLKEMAEVSEGKNEAWQRYSSLADTYQGLSELYDSRGEPGLAEAYRKLALSRPPVSGAGPLGREVRRGSRESDTAPARSEHPDTVPHRSRLPPPRWRELQRTRSQRRSPWASPRSPP